MPFFTEAGDPRLFHCGCGRNCDAPPPAPDLLARLENLRYRLGKAITVTSGPRCAYWNKQKGGKANSDHLTGEGADLAVPNSAFRDAMLEELYQRPRLFKRVGIGPDFVHVGLTTRNPGGVCWTYYQERRKP